MMKTRVVFIDTETGGLEPHHPTIQLAAIAVDRDFNELATFERKIRFNVADCEPEALAKNCYHGNETAWETAISPEGAYTDFSNFLKRFCDVRMISKRTGNPYSVAQLAGHNASEFDGKRLQAAFRHFEMFLPASYAVLDTLQLARWYSQTIGVDCGSMKLSEVCKAFGIETPDAHDALADCRASVQLAKKLTAIFKREYSTRDEAFDNSTT